MAGRSVLRSVLHNVLGTLVSRYSDLDGYWIWGQVVADPPEQPIDLLAAAETQLESPVEALRQLSRDRFVEQMTKHRVALSSLQAASLKVARGEEARAFVNGFARPGCRITLVASVSTGSATYSHTATLIVAPHEPTLESRRAPAQRGWARQT